MNLSAPYSFLAPIAALALAGCHGSQPLPYGFERGGALSPADYARLEPLVSAQPSTQSTVGDRPIEAYPLVTYVYSFRPGFDAAQITHLDIGSFSGGAGEMATVAKQLPADLAQRLTESGLPSTVLQSASSSNAYMLSGIVTRAGPPYLEYYSDNVAAQLEAKITQGPSEIGALQVNIVVKARAIASPIASLLIAAFESSRSEAIAGKVTEIMKRYKSGENQGTSVAGRIGYMLTPNQK